MTDLIDRAVPPQDYTLADRQHAHARLTTAGRATGPDDLRYLLAVLGLDQVEAQA